MIVDDNPSNLDLLGRILKEHCHRVRAITSGRRALESARLAPPDLILMDICMPEMDGFEACRQFKADPLLAPIPIIFISALDDTLDKVKAFTLGAEDYISKPFQAEEALARVDHQLRILGLQRELEERNRVLSEAMAGLQEMDQLKASFTAMLVHDLRSPITGIQVLLDLFEETGKLRPEHLSHARQSVQSTLVMLNDLMELFRSKAGEIPLELQRVGLERVLESSCGAHAILAGRKDIALSFQCAPELPEVTADPQKVDRILSNLLGNALSHTPPGGSIRLEADVTQGMGVDKGLRWVRISVTDTGQGIPADLLPYIFDPYRQASKRDGCHFGLGLAIAQRLMAAHQGRISVQSQLGVGTTFVLLFPA